MKRLIARLLAWLSPVPASPPLVAVARRYTGGTIEEALNRFEDACSDENFRTLSVLERRERAGDVLVRYEARWKYSVFDDEASGRHESWALLSPAAPGAADPVDARYRVTAASADHHIRL